MGVIFYIDHTLTHLLNLIKKSLVPILCLWRKTWKKATSGSGLFLYVTVFLLYSLRATICNIRWLCYINQFMCQYWEPTNHLLSTIIRHMLASHNNGDSAFKHTDTYRDSQLPVFFVRSYTSFITHIINAFVNIHAG